MKTINDDKKEIDVCAKLPRLLLLRSELFKDYLVTLVAMLVSAGIVTFSPNPTDNLWLAGAVGLAGVGYGALKTENKAKILRQDIETIRDEFNEYVNNKRGYSIYLAGKIYSPRLAKILIRFIAANDPYIFDKMMEDPSRITDPETLSHIIAGHMKKHPDIAGEIIKKFKPYGLAYDEDDDKEGKKFEIDPRIYALAKLHVQRLADRKARGYTRIELYRQQLRTAYTRAKQMPAKQ